MNLVSIKDIKFGLPESSSFECLVDSLTTSTGKLSANSVFGALKGEEGHYFM